MSVELSVAFIQSVISKVINPLTPKTGQFLNLGMLSSCYCPLEIDL